MWKINEPCEHRAQHVSENAAPKEEENVVQFPTDSRLNTAIENCNVHFRYHFGQNIFWVDRIQWSSISKLFFSSIYHIFQINEDKMRFEMIWNFIDLIEQKWRLCLLYVTNRFQNFINEIRNGMQ